MKRIALLSVSAVILIAAALVPVVAGESPVTQDDRPKAQKLMSQGNWKEAYDILSALAADKDDDPKLVSSDLTNGIQCLGRLGRIKEFDAFIEKVIAAHGKNWRLLQTAAQSYLGVQHYGTIVAGNFERGPHRGGTAKCGQCLRAGPRAGDSAHAAGPAGRGRGERQARGCRVSTWTWPGSSWAIADTALAWRLQYLSDLSKLPDYDDGYYGGWYYYGWGGTRGAPVDEDGNPVYYHVPKSWEDSPERRRAVAMGADDGPASARPPGPAEVKLGLRPVPAQPVRRPDDGPVRPADRPRRRRLGHRDGRVRPVRPAHARRGRDHRPAGDGRQAVQAARRVQLPQDHPRADGQARATATSRRRRLRQIFENRRQYDKAADVWRQAIKDYGDGGGTNHWRKRRLEQIVGNWGTFEPVMTTPPGGATVDFRFRNAHDA